jgi:hypothetical protein
MLTSPAAVTFHTALLPRLPPLLLVGPATAAAAASTVLLLLPEVDV